MIDLIARPPDSWHILEPQGYPASIAFYYGVSFAEVYRLPFGAHFGVVYSPNHHVHPESPLRPWHYTEFEVSLFQTRLGRGVERSYTQMDRRQLTRFEVPHFEALWADVVRMGKEREMA